MGGLRYLLFICWFFLAVVANTSMAMGHDDQITLVTPTLEATAKLGQAVSTILKLQVQKTLRKRDEKRPQVSLGRGVVYWVPSPLPTLSHGEAQRLARISGGQMTLWGIAVPYAGGAIAQTFLSIAKPYQDFRKERMETWTLRFSGRELSLGVPRKFVEFSPIAIERPLVEQYSSQDYLKFCDKKSSGKCFAGQWDDVYRILGWEGEYAKVHIRQQDYWLRVPLIDDNQSEVVDFTSGVMCHFRGDWNGVRDHMGRVLAGSTRGTELAIDANIYSAVASFRLGRSGTAELQRAFDLNPLVARSARFLAQGLLADAVFAPTSSSRTRLAVEALAKLQDNRSLFSPDDPWIAEATKFADKLRTSN